MVHALANTWRLVRLSVCQNIVSGAMAVAAVVAELASGCESQLEQWFAYLSENAGEENAGIRRDSVVLDSVVLESDCRFELQKKFIMVTCVAAHSPT